MKDLQCTECSAINMQSDEQACSFSGTPSTLHHNTAPHGIWYNLDFCGIAISVIFLRVARILVMTKFSLSLQAKNKSGP